MARSFISQECRESSRTPQRPAQTPTRSPGSQTPSSKTCREPRSSPSLCCPHAKQESTPVHLNCDGGASHRPHSFLPPSRSFLTLLSSQGSRLSQRQSVPSLLGSPKRVTQPSGLGRMFPALLTVHHALPCLTPQALLLPLPETLPLKPSLPSPPLFLLTFQPHHKRPSFRKDFLTLPGKKAPRAFPSYHLQSYGNGCDCSERVSARCVSFAPVFLVPGARPGM